MNLTRRYIDNTLFLLIALICCIAFQIDFSHAAALSKDEEAYVKKKGTIVFVSQTDYPPFEFVGIDGDHTGMCIDLVRWIATEFGFKVSFTSKSFKQAQEAVLSGKADVLTSLFYSKSRDEKFDFTKIMFRVPASIFIAAERSDIKDIHDLQGKSIAMQVGDYALEFLKSENLLFNLRYTENFAEAIDLVVTGKADALIGDEQVVQYHIITTNLVNKIKKVGAPLYVGQNCMAAKDPNPLLISILNKGIELADKKGLLDQIHRKWIGAECFALKHKWLKYIPYLIAAITVIILLSSLAWFWNFILRRQVAARTAALEISEQKYKFLTEKTANIIWTIDLNFQTTYVSPSIEIMLGFTPEERIKQTVEEMITPESLKSAQTLFLEELQRDKDEEADPNRSVSIEVEYYHKNGSIVWMENAVKAIRDHTGTIVGFHGISHNITERKQVEKELLAAELKYRSLVHNIPGMVYIAFPDWSSEIINDSESICGYTREEFNLKKVNWSEIIFPDDRERVFEEATKITKTEKKIVQTYRILTKNGDVRWVIDRKKSFFSEDAAFIRVEGIVFDITEQKRINDELISERNKLEEAFIKIKQLSGLLPICSYCKKIRDDKGYWNQIEKYISEHSDTLFSHGICPECVKKYYPEFSNPQ